jgi:polyhydroxyalkanoate synthesis regulator phasin
MKLTEKMSYLQGLLDGLEIDNSTKEGKALLQMSEVMSELVVYVEDLQSQVDELTELCDILDEDLGQVEDDLY